LTGERTAWHGTDLLDAFQPRIEVHSNGLRRQYLFACVVGLCRVMVMEIGRSAISAASRRAVVRAEFPREKVSSERPSYLTLLIYHPRRRACPNHHAPAKITDTIKGEHARAE